MSKPTVTVSAAALQDLIWNATLASANQGKIADTIARLSSGLQHQIDTQVGDANVVYGRDAVDEIDLDFTGEIIGGSIGDPDGKVIYGAFGR